MKIKHFMCSLIVITTIIPLAHANEVKRCLICGMNVSKYTHVKYTVTTTGSKKYVTCGVQCGLTLHLRLKNMFKSASATGLISHRTIDAAKAFYVFKSSVITDMAPGFIAFIRKANAEKFAKGFGGQVVTYDEALEIWKKRMQ